MAVTTRFGCYQEELKGEDGLRCERVEIGGDNLVFALLVDGHGGHQAASIVIGDLLPCMAGYLNDDPSAESLRHAASMAFQELHDQVRDPSNQTTAGTTCTLLIINETRGELTCAGVGDSWAFLYPAPLAPSEPASSATSVIDRDLARSVLGDAGALDAGEAGGRRKRGDHSLSSSPGNSREGSTHGPQRVVRLSTNDRLDDNDDERRRVVLCGGAVRQAMTPDGIKAGPLRAWPGGVACAKAIGDSDCGDFVSAEPCVMSIVFPPQGGAIAIASDGVWDAVSAEAAGKTIRAAADPDQAAERLVKQAVKARGLRDDTTCIVLVGGAPTVCDTSTIDLNSEDGVPNHLNVGELTALEASTHGGSSKLAQHTTSDDSSHGGSSFGTSPPSSSNSPPVLAPPERKEKTSSPLKGLASLLRRPKGLVGMGSSLGGSGGGGGSKTGSMPPRDRIFDSLVPSAAPPNAERSSSGSSMRPPLRNSSFKDMTAFSQGSSTGGYKRSPLGQRASSVSDLSSMAVSDQGEDSSGDLEGIGPARRDLLFKSPEGRRASRR